MLERVSKQSKAIKQANEIVNVEQPNFRREEFEHRFLIPQFLF